MRSESFWKLKTRSDLRRIKHIECRMHNTQPRKSDFLSFLLIHSIWWCWHGFVLIPAVVFVICQREHRCKAIQNYNMDRFYNNVQISMDYLFCVWVRCECFILRKKKTFTQTNRIDKHYEILYPFSKTPITQIALKQCVVGFFAT